MTDVADLPESAAWHAAVRRLLKGADPATLVTRSPDGIPVAPLYAPAEPAASVWRGAATPVGIVQPVDSPDPGEAARLAVLDQEGGATALTLVFAGASAARGFGLPHEGFEAVLDAVDSARMPIRADLPPGDAAVLGRLRAAAARTGAHIDLASDPLATAAQAGIDPLPALDRWIADVVPHAPAGPVIRADGRAYHNAGATAAQELAAVLATSVAALRALERAAFDNPVAFTLVADADQLFTVAKLRALRRLWGRVEQLCGRPPSAIDLHVETSWRMLACRDPWTNLLRNTIACTGAILGGADSVTVLPFTAAQGLPDAFARRLARNTPHVLLDEAGLGRVADPLAGSGAIEALTEALCQKAWSVFRGVEQAGGMAAALAAGSWQERLAESRAARAEAVRSGRYTIVGVSAFAPPPEMPMPAVLRPFPGRLHPGVGSDARTLAAYRDAQPFEDEPAAGAPA